MEEFKGVRNVFIREIPEEKLYLLNTLIENGIQPEIQGINTLEWAIKNKNEKLVEQIIPTIDVTADNNKVIRLASEFSSAPIVEMIIKAGADVTTNDNEPIVNDARNGDKEVVTLLLAAGANPLARNNMALLVASQNGHTEVLKILVDFINKKKQI